LLYLKYKRVFAPPQRELISKIIAVTLAKLRIDKSFLVKTVNECGSLW
jgi:hypothetical protein